MATKPKATLKKKPTNNRTVKKPTTGVKKSTNSTKKKPIRVSRLRRLLTGGFEAKYVMFALTGSAAVLVLGFTGYAFYTKMSASASADATTSTSLTTLISNAGSAKSLTLAAGTYTFNDFAQIIGGTYEGALIPTTMTSFTGAGISKTTVKMTTNSSKSAKLVPTASGTTNQLSLMMFQKTSPTIGNFTLAGTTQGHLYNGLRLSELTSPKITNVKVTGIPGNDHEPPGETFGINDYKTTNAVYKAVEVDGTGIGASGLGVNDSTNPTINDSYFHQNTYAMGVTFWKTASATMNNTKTSGNRTAINFEMDTGTFTLNNPTFGTSSSGHDINIGSDAASIKLNIHDPVFTGGQTKLRINIGKTYGTSTNAQKKSDIHVYVGSADKTSSLVTWLP